ncbi:uncharacterized protein LOC134204984 isoform X2 [Armigeres subalbatus]|uniref:uncharacterized protein LOC134204984 isoform X2 n=1 Tax=Armigeres subalbatus TaxID=124917 RepID=UPI002ED4051C
MVGKYGNNNKAPIIASDTAEYSLKLSKREPSVNNILLLYTYRSLSSNHDLELCITVATSTGERLSRRTLNVLMDDRMVDII